MKSWLVLAGAVATALLVFTSQPAVCQEDGCSNAGCSEELPCPNPACGCLIRPGQPFGQCRPY